MYVTAPFSIVGDASLYNRRPRLENQFVPLALQEEASSEIADFVPKPLYTGRQLEEFRRRHTKNRVFQVLEDTVQSAEDLESFCLSGRRRPRADRRKTGFCCRRKSIRRTVFPTPVLV
ncbi:MAG: hypothetical protein ACLURV_02050 [Gallintestinimicrobium sp.]